MYVWSILIGIPKLMYDFLSQVYSCHFLQGFQARCRMKLMWDPTPSQRVYNRFFLFGKKQQPVLPPSNHAEQTLYSSAPACSCWNSSQELLGTFPHRLSELLNTMPFMPRGENRRSACSVNPIMWRTCSIFCAWSLLFLSEVCAQTQQRYTFIYILFFFHLIWVFCQCARCQWSHVGGGEAGVYSEEYSAVWDYLQSGHMAHWRGIKSVLNQPQAVVNVYIYLLF